MAEAIIEKKKGLSPVWILPILAICLGGWLIFRSVYEAGIDIILSVEDSSGIVANRTPVMYNGNQVGLVKEIHIRRELNGVDLSIEMNKEVESYLVEDLALWIERVNVSASRVSGLDTILTGNYIGVQLGTSIKQSRNFVALPHRPPAPPNTPGLHLTLQAKNLNSLEIGSGIYNKSIRVGSVQEYELQDDDNVLIRIHIQPDYSHLVRNGTRFLNASGITVSGGITDLKVNVASLSSLLSGGVEMRTPEDLRDTAPAKNGDIFTLYDDLDEFKRDDGVEITLQVEDSTGITTNRTPVMYKGNQVGIVKDIRLRKDLQGVDLVIEMKKEAESYLVEDLVFWIERVDVQASKVSGLETLLAGNYIGVQLGVSVKPERNFIALNRRPPVPRNAPGLHLKLRADKFKSLDIGSGIYNQNIKIGSVQDYVLQDDNTVLIDVYIEPEYEHLIKNDSRFWNASGITVSGGITDLKVHISSISSILIGGINVDTPDTLLDTPQAENDQVFPLFSDLEALAAVNKPVGLHIVLDAEDLGSISLSSGVYYRKIKVGEVTETKLSETFHNVLIDVTIYEPFVPIIRENTMFWSASGVTISGGVLRGLSISTESLQSVMTGGIALATPNNDKMGGMVSEGHRFTLHDKEDESWRKWSPKINPKKNK